MILITFELRSRFPLLLDPYAVGTQALYIVSAATLLLVVWAEVVRLCSLLLDGGCDHLEQISRFEVI